MQPHHPTLTSSRIYLVQLTVAKGISMIRIKTVVKAEPEYQSHRKETKPQTILLKIKMTMLMNSSRARISY